ncbi:MAG: cell division protein ZipA [Cellvibrionaceae bacterium]|nr:cell division protein ZipA [Cellvibrionaceae bacterium]
MREWLTVIIVLLILGVLLDGMRRMRAHRRDHLRMKHRVVARADTDSGETEVGTSEFPSGGARVAAYRDPDHVLNVNKAVKESLTASRWTRGAPNRLPEQVSLNLDTPVPMLMDSVDEQVASVSANERDPVIGDLADLEDDDLRPGIGDSEFTQEFYEDEDLSSESEAEPAPAPAEPVQKKREPERVVQEDAPKAPDEVLIINVMARRGEMFAGTELLEALVTQGLRYGDMDIFHRHESDDGRGKILFSAANMVVPGTFDLGAMEDFATPGISMFLSLPISGDSLAAYNLMANSATAIADALGGELKDENRSVMTRQTIEHGRQRVIEYERKRRLAKS